MKKPILLLAILPILVSACGGGGQAEQEQVADARFATEQFSATLKQALMHGLSQGGPETALQLCSKMAPAIAADAETETGWHLARTSLKPRNPANRPDPWEQQILQRFEERKAAGAGFDQLEHHEVVTEDGQRVFRYMKAIPTGKLCLQCHGNDLAPAVADKLQEVYPDDQATGFSEGDLRGAFSLKRPL